LKHKGWNTDVERLLTEKKVSKECCLLKDEQELKNSIY